MLFFSGNGLLAVELKFRHYKQDNGLSSNTVQCLYQDSKGYIWIGTSDGLNRFDSKNFNVYRNEKNNPNSIGNNSIYSICEDDDNNLWIGTGHGIYLYNPKNDRFKKVALPESNSIAGNMLVYSIARGKDKDMWISTLGNGLFRYKAKSGKIEHFTKTGKKSSLYSDAITSVLVDAKGDVWVIAGGNVINKYNARTNDFTQIPILDAKARIGMQNAFSMCEDSFGNLWITGVNSGVFKYDKSNGGFTSYLVNNGKPVIQNRIHTVMESEPGTLMLSSDHGAFIFNFIKNTYTQVSYDPLNNQSLNDRFVYPIIRDREGGLWIGTYWGGLNYCSQYNYYFSLYTFTTGKNALSGRIVSKFCEDRSGNIWIGMDDGGLNKFDPVAKKFQKIIVDPINPNLNIHALFLDGEDLWIGTYALGLYRMNIKTGKVKHYYKESAPGLNDMNVYSIFKDSAGKLWIGTKKNINVFNYETERFICVAELNYNCDVLDIAEDHEGVVWFASIGKGIIAYQSKTGKLRYYSKNDNDVDNVPNQCRSLSFDNKRLWVGTAGNGLWYYNRELDKFVKEKAANTFEDNSTIFHIISNYDDLWMTTNEGLVKYNQKYKKANFYNFEDGLQGNLFNPNSGLKASTGEIYLGGNNGFNVFSPEKLPEVSNALKIVFTQFDNFNRPVSIDENSVLESHIDYQRSVELKKKNAVFSFEFVALNFGAPSRIRYRYMLEGFDKEWVYVKDNNRKATYTNLSPGSYVFRVMASDNSEWNASNESSVKVNILPSWWMTRPFIVFFIVFAVVLLSFSYWFILRRGMKKQNERLNHIQQDREHKLTKEKMNFFNSIAHEIRTPATLISVPVGEIMKMPNIPMEIKEDLATVQRNSDRLLNLINQILDFNRLEHLTLNKYGKTNINRLINDTVEQFSSISKSKDISINILSEDEIYAWLDPEAFTKIFSNLLVNALKYTKNSVSITLEPMDDGFFKLIVSDNGKGIEQENLDKIFSLFYHTFENNNLSFTGFGVGLAIVSLLVSKIGASITVESIPGEFTAFSVRFPIGNCSDLQTESEAHLGEAEGRQLFLKEELKTEIPFNEANEKEKKATILIVEDNEDLLNYMKKILEKEYLVVVAGNGTVAVERLHQQRVDIVVSDVVMPEMTGYELCTYIKKSEGLNHIPIILLSAIVNLDSKIKGLEYGADVYVDKPISMEYLSAQIVSLLEKRDNFRIMFSKTPFMPIHSISERQVEKEFLSRVNDIVEKNIMNSEFSIEDITAELNVSRSVLYNKTKSIAGMAPLDFVRLVRLRKAAEYLCSKKYKINEVCYMVGFNSPSYFSKCFQSQFGMLPKDFQNRD